MTMGQAGFPLGREQGETESSHGNMVPFTEANKNACKQAFFI
jgi:hypothetical protein